MYMCECALHFTEKAWVGPLHVEDAGFEEFNSVTSTKHGLM